MSSNGNYNTIFNLLKDMPGGGNLSISSGGTSVEIIRNGTVRTTRMTGGSITTSVMSNCITINGQTFSLTDPHAVDGMELGTRETFWSYCDEEAKNSDLYRNYATSILAPLGINPESFESESFKKCVYNKAKDIVDLIKFCQENRIHNWQTELFVEDEEHETLLTNTSSIKEMGKTTETGLIGHSDLNHPVISLIGYVLLSFTYRNRKLSLSNCKSDFCF